MNIADIHRIDEATKPQATTGIPSELSYLNPAIEIINNIADEDLGDGNNVASAAIDSAVCQRTAGLDKQAAKLLLLHDYALLVGLLKRCDMKSSKIHHIKGWYFGYLIYS